MLHIPTSFAACATAATDASVASTTAAVTTTAINAATCALASTFSPPRIASAAARPSYRPPSFRSPAFITGGVLQQLRCRHGF
eukprot:7386211-Prymnesium_polylepis.1